MKKLSVYSAYALAVFVVPAMTYAGGLTDFLTTVRGWLNMLVPMAITVGIIAFFFGLAKYLWGDVEDHKKGLTIMIMGILAVFVMASLGGLVSLLQDTTGAGHGSAIIPPCVGKACSNGGQNHSTNLTTHPPMNTLGGNQ